MFGRKVYNRCPVDHEPLVLCELEGIEVDYCPACGGCWIDRGELDLIAAHAGANPVECEIGAAPTQPSERSCPRCARKLHRLECRGIQLERCNLGHGVWLDRGELETLTHKTGGAFLADMFKNEIESSK